MDVNPLKKIWEAGNIAVGSYIMYSRDIVTVELAASANLDFVVDGPFRIQALCIRITNRLTG